MRQPVVIESLDGLDALMRYAGHDPEALRIGREDRRLADPSRAIGAILRVDPLARTFNQYIGGR